MAPQGAAAHLPSSCAGLLTWRSRLSGCGRQSAHRLRAPRAPTDAVYRINSSRTAAGTAARAGTALQGKPPTARRPSAPPTARRCRRRCRALPCRWRRPDAPGWLPRERDRACAADVGRLQRWDTTQRCAGGSPACNRDQACRRAASHCPPSAAPHSLRPWPLLRLSLHARRCNAANALSPRPPSGPQPNILEPHLHLPTRPTHSAAFGGG